MAAPKPQHRKSGVGSDNDIRAAENYLDSLLSSEDEVSADEIDSVRESVEAIRRGEITLAEFERRHDL
ncbi:MAG: hypothetical protein M1436_02550 [Acidobacteria bacterium]|nr:hypothetical protein [Acidobacteriota bacterium]